MQALSKPQRRSRKALPSHEMHSQLGQLSPAAQDFFDRALCLDPAARLTVAQALQHEFLRADSSHPMAVPEAVLAGFASNLPCPTAASLAPRAQVQNLS